MPTKLAIVKIVARSDEPFQLNVVLRPLLEKLAKEASVEIDWGFYLKPGTNHRVWDDELDDGQWLELKQMEEKANNFNYSETLEDDEKYPDEAYEDYFDQLEYKKKVK